VREPYATQVRKIVEAALADPQTHDRTRASLQTVLAFLRLPEDQRVLRQLTRQMDSEDLAKPLIRAGNELNIASDLDGVIGRSQYEPFASRAVEEMDAAARAAEEWQGLGLAYSYLARGALRRGLRDRADVYVDRMLAIVREHPQFQDPNRGNTDAVSPTGVARLLASMGRTEDLDALLAALDLVARVELIAGATATYAGEGKFDEARQLVEARMRPLSPAAADRLAAALDGRIVPLPKPATTTSTAPTTSSTRRSRRRETDPAEMRLRDALSIIAHGHARRGEIEIAAQQLIALEADRVHLGAGPGQMPSYQWARLAYEAHQGGRADAARRALERALEMLPVKSVDEPHETTEKTGFVREAMAAGDMELAGSMLGTTSAPGAGGYYRLAKAYRARGDAARADALVEKALTIASKGRGGGSTMAAIAVDLHAAGEVQRAEELLTRAIDHIEGVDFGFSGTHSIVHAAMRMNRLDLLDRLYETYDPGERMLLCIVASRAGFFPLAEDKDRE
jgi:tetratricopeptide (TPR) repeat protein